MSLTTPDLSASILQMISQNSIIIATSISIIALSVAIIGLVLNRKAEQHKKSMSFREDYHKEIKPLLDYFQQLLTSSSFSSWGLKALFEHNPRLSKRILQHLYTCSETKLLYDIVKNMVNKKLELEKQGVNYDKINESLGIFVLQFRDKFYPIWAELETIPNPDFGICEKCKDIKLKHVKNKKKILEKSDPVMWNLFERSESK